jgi:hypothetical protein
MRDDPGRTGTGMASSSTCATSGIVSVRLYKFPGGQLALWVQVRVRGARTSVISQLRFDPRLPVFEEAVRLILRVLLFGRGQPQLLPNEGVEVWTYFC